ncbi:MAG: hypothetical protein ABS86_02795 [Sphingobium sp. SCN 64-10]|nr:MAG: hypothetical protein ABS86_02795 [Sphingobium sp. SCN 64-10]
MFALMLSSCDGLSQRIWNCSAQPLAVTKVLDNGERVHDTIPSRSYIASMKGGVQILALEAVDDRDKRVIWASKEAKSGFVAEPNDGCRERKTGLIAEKF